MTRRFVRPLAALVALLPMALHAATPAPHDLGDTVNAIRAGGCDGTPAAVAPLRRDGRLDRAAAAIAAGGELKDALRSADYRAAEAAVLEATGDAATIGRALADKGCKEILGAAYRDMGIAQRAGRSWVLFAAPLEAPAASDAENAAARVLALVNGARLGKRRCGLRRFEPAPALTASAALQRAARAHAEDMARRGVMEHAGGDGSTPAERATRAGYSWQAVGENIASGQSTPEQVVAEWLGSPRHCANIMDAEYSEMGVAFAASAHGLYWAQVFGAPAH
jgi:uncharacterized protein YkwD